MGMGFGPQPEPTEATDEEVRAAIEAAEQTEVTDAEVRAIFSDEGPKGWTAREFEAIEA